MAEQGSTTNDHVLVIIGVGGMVGRCRAGCTTVLADINADGVTATADALTEDGHHATTHQVDVTSRGSVAAVAATAR